MIIDLFKSQVHTNRRFMQIAIKEAKLSMNERAGSHIPKIYIGATLVNDQGQILGKAHKVENGSQRIHAEYQLLADLPTLSNQRLTLYTTLEPCNFRHKENLAFPSCVKLIQEKKIGSVVVGMLDPHPAISGKAVERLMEFGIKVEILEDKREYEDLINELRTMNQEFIHFQW